MTAHLIPRAAFFAPSLLIALTEYLAAPRLSLLLSLAAWQRSLSAALVRVLSFPSLGEKLSSKRHNVICSSSLRDLREIDFKINFKRSALGAKQVGFWFGFGFVWLDVFFV